MELEQERQRNDEMEDALCEIDTAYEERIADIEDALCELDAGGEEE